MARDFAVQLTASGTTKNLERFLKMAGQEDTMRNRVDAVARRGLEALRAATPVRSGLTAASWSYRIVEDRTGFTIEYHNFNVNQGRNIVVLIRYGHGTRNGGYVPPNDFITPTLKPIFDQIAYESWRAVTSA